MRKDKLEKGGRSGVEGRQSGPEVVFGPRAVSEVSDGALTGR